jgi:hypothetical protein
VAFRCLPDGGRGADFRGMGSRGRARRTQVAVAAQVLGPAVDDHVDSERQGHWFTRGEGVVEDRDDAPFRPISPPADVDDSQQGLWATRSR